MAAARVTHTVVSLLPTEVHYIDIRQQISEAYVLLFRLFASSNCTRHGWRRDKQARGAAKRKNVRCRTASTRRVL